MTHNNSGKYPSGGYKRQPRAARKKLQVRNRFEALRTDDEEFLVIDERDDPGSSEVITNKQHQGNMQNQARRHRTVPMRLHARGDGK